jgi:tetratricopeptide (TPR) repeat protein
MKNKHFFICILFLLLLDCTWQKSIVIKDTEYKDVLELLIYIVEEHREKNGYYSEKEISDKTAMLASLCNKKITISKNDSLEELEHKLEIISKLDNIFDKYTTDGKNNQLAIVLKELQFRVLVATQIRMAEAFNKREKHQGFVFNIRISKTLPYIQNNRQYGKTKLKLLKDIIGLLSILNTNIEKKRCWLAINRMVNEIDIKKSESGYEPFQRSPFGIYTQRGEISSLLKAQQKKETDQDILEFSTKLINKIEKRLKEKKDRKFWAEVQASKEINQKYKVENIKLKSSINDETVSNDPKLDNAQTASDWFSLGFHARDNNQKIEYYTKAIELDTKYASAYYNRAIAYQNINNLEEAIQDYSKAIDHNPQYAPAFINCGNIYQNLGKFKEAIQDYSKAIELDPQNTDLYNYRSMCYKYLEQYDEAIRDFDKVISFNLQDTSTYVHRGDAYRNSGKNEEAIQDYNTALELNPHYALAYNNRGICYNNIGKYHKAIQDHKKALEIKPNYALAYYNLGISFWKLRKWNKVIEAWEKCLEIDPDYDNARKWLPKAKEAAKPKTIIIKREIEVYK